MLRRRSLIAASIVSGLCSPSLQAKETSLPKTQDLQKLGERALASQTPLVILVSLPGCPYCELIRRTYLIPYRTEINLQSWQLDTTDKSALVDFAGKRTTPAQWLTGLRIKVTPTVLFLNGKGQEIAPRLEGVSIPDFYGAYLDERLALANSKAKQQS
jgi:thioredoxin-related protein